MIVGECITALLFPFKWPHVYAPILPAALHHFLDAPVPFVMGLHAECEINTKIGTEATLCYVDIDKKTIQLPEEMPVFPHKVDFMSEIVSILDKFQIERDKTMEPPSILNPKSFCNQRDYDVMSSSCTLPSGLHVRRKYTATSGYHDNMSISNHWGDHGSDMVTQPLLSNGPSSGQTPTPKSEALQRIVDIVKRTGVQLDDMDLNNDIMPSSRKQRPLTSQEQYYEDQRLNNSIREIFLNRFVHMFAAYEHFVILPNQDKDDWLTNRESLQNFDKASFLSDQPEHHRPFLCRFLESQMFATLIDNKIMAVWDKDMDPNLKLFDSRIKLLR